MTRNFAFIAPPPAGDSTIAIITREALWMVWVWRNSSEKQAYCVFPSYPPHTATQVLSSTGGWTAARPLFSRGSKAKPKSTISRPLEAILLSSSLLLPPGRSLPSPCAPPLFQWPPAVARFFNAGRSDFLSRHTHRRGSRKRQTERLSSATALSDNNGVEWGIAPREGFPQLSSLPQGLTRRQEQGRRVVS